MYESISFLAVSMGCYSTASGFLSSLNTFSLVILAMLSSLLAHLAYLWLFVQSVLPDYVLAPTVILKLSQSFA